MKQKQQSHDQISVAVAPFTVLVDRREQAPWPFRELTDAHKVPLIVPTQPATLRTGDYAVDGMVDRFVVERKSRDDLIGCLTSDRERFEAEIQRAANEHQCAAVVVECGWGGLLSEPTPGRRYKPETLRQTILAWMVRYRTVHWMLCPTRREAEITAFHLLRQVHRAAMAEETTATANETKLAIKADNGN